METTEIKELIELISRSNFTTFELEREGFRLKLVKAENSTPPAPARPEIEPAAAAAANSAAVPVPAAEGPAAGFAAEDGLYAFRSPIVGTFYSAPSSGAPQFVEVGSRVTKGQVLCIVEAMKVMNEIESEFDAEVMEILVANGQPVEYGEVLFRLRPLS